MKKIFLNIIKTALVFIALFFISKVFMKNIELIKDYSWRPDIVSLLLSFLFLAFVFFFFVTGWYFILRALDVRLPVLEVSRIWILSQFGKYIPGHVWQFVGRIAFLAENGISKSRGLLSIHLESSSSILAATLTLLISLLFSAKIFSGVNMPLILTAIVVCFVFLHPKALEIAINTMLTILKREKVKVDFSFKDIILITSYYMLGWFVLSLSFYYLVKSLYAVDSSIFFDIAFSFTASYVIGFLAIFAPGGIGIREGFLILFLKQTIPEFITTVVSIASRLWFMIGELLSLIIIMTLYKFLCKKENKS